MKNLAFVFTGILALIGINTLIITIIINRVLPKIGYAAYQISPQGTYSESFYKINFTGVYIFAAFLSLIGISTCIYLYKNRE